MSVIKKTNVNTHFKIVRNASIDLRASVINKSPILLVFWLPCFVACPENKQN